MPDNNEITVIKRNMQPLTELLPVAYTQNVKSVERCEDAVADLLLRIEAEGMTEKLAEESQLTLKKTANTVKKMMERRQPITKILDEIRGEFTALEKKIDAVQKDTLPYKLREAFTAYLVELARQKEEAERKAREEMLVGQETDAYRRTLGDSYNGMFKAYLEAQLQELDGLFSAMTLENMDGTVEQVAGFPVELSPAFLGRLRDGGRQMAAPGVRVSESDRRTMPVQVFTNLEFSFKDRFMKEVRAKKQDLLEKIPGKAAALKEAAAKGEEERGRMEAELAEKEKRQREKEKEERCAREAEEKARLEAEQKVREAGDLFAAAAATAQPVSGFQPKIKVTKKIELREPSGILQIITMWWSKEGKDMTVEELMKMFRRQVTFCERLANKDDIFLEDAAIAYVDDVKAK